MAKNSKYSDELIGMARSLYLKRWTPKEIAAELKLNSTRIIYHWADKNGWRGLLSEEDLESVINRRAAVLADKPNKNDIELKELDKYIDMHCKLIVSRHKHTEKIHAMNLEAAARGISASGTREVGGTIEAIASEGESGKKRRGKRNDISGITPDDFAEFVDNLFDYQLTLREAKIHRNRIWLKSRQIGATWYAAFEALEDAILTGNNQAFLSASRPQSLIFRRYIIKFAFELFGIELTGDPIVLSNGAELHFLSTNTNTAQGFCANVYIDEIFWQRGFTQLKNVAAAIATHSYLRRTYISTPSAKTHQAYPFWSGDEWRKGKKERENVTFPSFAEMQGGVMCPDNHWRFITTIEDAIAGGAHILMDIEELREENGESAFNQLYMCLFVDTGDCVFRFDQLEKCLVTVSNWEDHDVNAARPFGNREVWAGYDPARSGDTASFVLVAPPQADGEPFRVLHIETWHGFAFKYQVGRIKEYMARYNITHIGIDSTGIGGPVCELVQEFARREVTQIHYSPESKNRLVMKMIDLVEHKRIAWDIEDKSIGASFMAIRHTTTKMGGAMTFVADRSADTGHADRFFAIAHAVINEPINNERKRKSGWAKRFTGKNNEQTQAALQRQAAKNQCASHAGTAWHVQHRNDRYTDADFDAGNAVSRNLVRLDRRPLAATHRPTRAGATCEHVRAPRRGVTRPPQYGYQ
ncbi:terminase [Yersinia pseudotuberculosis]|uniref:Terminase, ATPase subunit n=1 Tax=Yersinia pseudotuberculosis serotype O:3 (strain YPIII) TaxID=502800 RepID=A0A0H3AYQ8_YERPY|nr:terminase family protein [Yersinia pseudotuberculosis]AJJ59025.1 ATPase subunit of terminase family protein [Yersinia pseudotuberculosis YPIII]AYW87002.1 terminase [Yersinia pseudotuberculosis]AYX01606.1 terminase [Yersinia pseudotuberculosis]AZA29360.1 terminase [Yersinia pseudotuberculosis]MBK1425887.1 terminase [Yersinia pseudotuberculosis]